MLRTSEQNGQSYIEFLLVLPLLLLIIAGVMGFGQLLYAKLAVEAAAWASARQAIATLNQSQGLTQAHLAARYTLNGFGLNPDHAQQQVTVIGQWQRGAQLRSRVCYRVAPPPVPLGSLFGSQLICATETLPVYPWKSKW